MNRNVRRDLVHPKTFGLRQLWISLSRLSFDLGEGEADGLFPADLLEPLPVRAAVEGAAPSTSRPVEDAPGNIEVDRPLGNAGFRRQFRKG